MAGAVGRELHAWYHVREFRGSCGQLRDRAGFASSEILVPTSRSLDLHPRSVTTTVSSVDAGRGAAALAACVEADRRRHRQRHCSVPCRGRHDPAGARRRRRGRSAISEAADLAHRTGGDVGGRHPRATMGAAAQGGVLPTAPARPARHRRHASGERAHQYGSKGNDARVAAIASWFLPLQRSTDGVSVRVSWTANGFPAQECPS